MTGLVENYSTPSNMPVSFLSLIRPNTFPKLSALPLRKNTPPRTSICEYKTPPRTPLSDLDHRLPRCPIRITQHADVLHLSRKPDNLARRRLDGEFSRLHAGAA